MARKKSTDKSPKKGELKGHIENAGLVVGQPIVDTLKQNYMPYAMSVIVSRAIPEIDGFKPSHRKILYTMYKMGLLTGTKIKSANIVGQTMRLNPHGDAAIYETMVRLSRGHSALIAPFIESKGNFGRAYSRDMAYAASRYTEAKLEKICTQVFADIDKNTVNFVDNYDSTMKEPQLLPVTFPTVLVNANTGIAVGMASNICSFNITEVCETAIARIKNSESVISDTLKAPDFAGGGYIIYNSEELEKIYSTGRGAVKVRCKYSYDKSNNCIDITQIPSTTTIEAIVDKIVDLVKQGKIREIADIRDETDLSGLKITIDLKRGVDHEKLMQKLYKSTALEDNFSCNFNILVGTTPRVLGVGSILDEWILFRRDCVKRGVAFELAKKKEKLHLLKGLSRILLDIDKAVSIVRETEEEKEVVPNLMIGFGIDELQADYVAELRLRHLNREHILKRTAEIEQLRDEIDDMEDTLENPKKVDKMMITALQDVIKNFGEERRSEILYQVNDVVIEEDEEIPNYPVKFFFTKEGYFKKITPQSFRMSSEHKLKQDDEILMDVDSQNDAHLLFFTNKCQVYKSRGNEFDDTKASVLGDFLPSKLGFDQDEQPVYMAVVTEFKGYVIFVFENGKIAKVDLSSYETKTKRKKLLAAFSDKSPLIYMQVIQEDLELLIHSNTNRRMILNTAMLSSKTTRSTQGVQVMTLKKDATVARCEIYKADSLEGEHRIRVKAIPSAGSLIRVSPEQISLFEAE